MNLHEDSQMTMKRLVKNKNLLRIEIGQLAHKTPAHGRKNLIRTPTCTGRERIPTESRPVRERKPASERKNPVRIPRKKSFKITAREKWNTTRVPALYRGNTSRIRNTTRIPAREKVSTTAKNTTGIPARERI